MRAPARYLVGDGVELGPGHSPFPVPYSGTTVRYVDRWVPDTNRDLFPELGEATFPMPDIVADLDTDRLRALDDESQDFVIASHVLEHLANPLAMLGEIHRVLRSGASPRAAPRPSAYVDRDRLPTPVQHLVAEYEADVTTVSDAHIEDFLPASGNGVTTGARMPARQEIDRQRQRSIHVHCWSQDEFPDTLLHVIETGHQPWDLVDAVFVEDVADSIEFGYVLRKLRPIATRRSSEPDSARCSIASARFSSTEPRAPEGARTARLSAPTSACCGASPRQSRRTAAQQPAPSRTCEVGAAAIAVRTSPRAHPVCAS